MAEETQLRTMVDIKNSEIEGASAHPVLDAACLAELRALDPDGQAQLVKRVLATYQTSLVRLADQLRQARAQAAWEPVSRVAHTLKSSSASIGALALAGLCADIERLLRGGDHAGVAPLLDRFDAEAARVEIAVRAELAGFEVQGS
jgi:HPt (histidine-containing phosphotransfer) domain-containing protein